MYFYYVKTILLLIELTLLKPTPRWDITEDFIMKKITLLLAVALFAVTFTSCQQTEPYNPKEKISKIYVDHGLGKSLSEVWNWDGKQLKTIEYYIGMSNFYTEEFTYNKNDQLQKVEGAGGDARTEYIYNKFGRLHKIKHFDYDVNTVTYTFEYDDNKLSEMIIVTSKFIVPDKSIATPLKYILPELSVVKMDKMLSNIPAERGGIRLELDIDWRGNNISEIEVESGEYTEKYYFKYDDKLSPLRNFWGLDFGGINDNIFVNKNNIVEYTVVTSYAGSFCAYADTEYISYTYDGKFPVTKSHGDTIEYYEYE